MLLLNRALGTKYIMNTIDCMLRIGQDRFINVDKFVDEYTSYKLKCRNEYKGVDNIAKDWAKSERCNVNYPFSSLVYKYKSNISSSSINYLNGGLSYGNS